MLERFNWQTLVTRPNGWRPPRAVLRVRLYALLIASDFVLLTLSFLVANQIVSGDLFAEQGMVFGRVLSPIYFAVAAVTGCYSVTTGVSARKSVTKTARALLIAAVTFVILAFTLKISSTFSRLLIGLAVTLALASLSAARLYIARRATRLLGGNPWDTIVICDETDDLSLPPGCSMVIRASDLIDPALHSPDMFDRLARAIGYADRVIVRCPPERRTIWAAALRGANVQGEIMAPELAPFRPYGLSQSGGLPTIVVAQGPLRLFQRVMKRGMDLAIAGLAILALLPLLLIIALAVRLSSPGPIFFVQTRIGRQNRLFSMLKFRSMRVEGSDEAGNRSTARDDDRITRVGRILRRTSLDELPQLFNVLLGNMSIVGPRPHALASTAADLLFWEINSNYWDRHAMKPGLTGLAQVRGYRGATHAAADLENRLSSDMEYVRNWSLSLDLLILARTAMVLMHRNAY